MVRRYPEDSDSFGYVMVELEKILQEAYVSGENDKATTLSLLEEAQAWLWVAQGKVDGHCRVCRGDARGIDWPGGERHTCE